MRYRMFGFLLVSVFAASAGAKSIDNGLNANGLNANGLNANGLNANGLNANGLNANGLNANGLNANGLNANGLDVRGATPPHASFGNTPLARLLRDAGRASLVRPR